MSKTKKYGKTAKEVREPKKHATDKYWEHFHEQEMEEVDFYLSPSIMAQLRKEA